jgi:hypothetical protein
MPICPARRTPDAVRRLPVKKKWIFFTDRSNIAVAAFAILFCNLINHLISLGHVDYLLGG